MAFCDPLDRGLTPFCGPNLGGVVEAYITDFDQINGASYSFTASNTIIDGIEEFGPGDGFYKFEFREDTSSFDQTNTPTNSADIVEQVGTLVFQQHSTIKNSAFNLLRGKKLLVIYKDSNGQFWLSGKDLGVRLTNLEQTGGSDRNDDNIYTLTLTARETEFAYEVENAGVIPLAP
jgi:hypothetical protein